jgi:hypothetical protein
MSENLIAIVDGFKLIDGPCCLISADDTGLAWLREQMARLHNTDSQYSFSIGEEGVFFPVNVRMRVYRDADVNVNSVTFVGPNKLLWRLGTEAVEAAKAKLEGMTTCSMCHNYFEVEAGGVQEIIISLNEYDGNTIMDMAEYPKESN